MEDSWEKSSHPEQLVKFGGMIFGFLLSVFSSPPWKAAGAHVESTAFEVEPRLVTKILSTFWRHCIIPNIYARR